MPLKRFVPKRGYYQGSCNNWVYANYLFDQDQNCYVDENSDENKLIQATIPLPKDVNHLEYRLSINSLNSIIHKMNKVSDQNDKLMLEAGYITEEEYIKMINKRQILF